MSECLCPRCGYIWDNTLPPPSAELKRAVESHLAGEADSVWGALFKQQEPQRRAKRIVVQGYCQPLDLKRYRHKQLLDSVHIYVGGIYCWEPDSLWSEVLEVTKIKRVEGDPDPLVFTKLPSGQEVYNDMSRCREALVMSNLRVLPNG